MEDFSSRLSDRYWHLTERERKFVEEIKKDKSYRRSTTATLEFEETDKGLVCINLNNLAEFFRDADVSYANNLSLVIKGSTMPEYPNDGSIEFTLKINENEISERALKDVCKLIDDDRKKAKDAERLAATSARAAKLRDIHEKVQKGEISAEEFMKLV